jgi:hypothetical protein
MHQQTEQEWHFNGEVVYQFRGFAFGGVCKGITGTGRSHSIDVGVHSRPVVAETNTVKCTVGVEMSTYGIRMKFNKDDVVKFFQNELEAGV